MVRYFHRGCPCWLLNWELQCSDRFFRQGVIFMMIVFPHFLFLIGLVSITHLLFCSLLFVCSYVLFFVLLLFLVLFLVFPLISKLLVELRPLFFSYNLPKNVVGWTSTSRSSCNSCVLLCRYIRGSHGCSCILHRGPDAGTPGSVGFLLIGVSCWRALVDESVLSTRSSINVLLSNGVPRP